MGKIIGIDLGTTNSVVAVMEGTEATVIPTRKVGAPLHPLSDMQRIMKHLWGRWPKDRL